jgi:uncharacterized protein YoxC
MTHTNRKPDLKTREPERLFEKFANFLQDANSGGVAALNKSAGRWGERFSKAAPVALFGAGAAATPAYEYAFSKDQIRDMPVLKQLREWFGVDTEKLWGQKWFNGDGWSTDTRGGSTPRAALLGDGYYSAPHLGKDSHIVEDLELPVASLLNGASWSAIPASLKALRKSRGVVPRFLATSNLAAAPFSTVAVSAASDLASSTLDATEKADKITGKEGLLDKLLDEDKGPLAAVNRAADTANDAAEKISDVMEPVADVADSLTDMNRVTKGLSTAAGGVGGAGLGYILASLLDNPNYGKIKNYAQLEEAKAKARRNKLLGALLGLTGGGIGSYYALNPTREGGE